MRFGRVYRFLIFSQPRQRVNAEGSCGPGGEVRPGAHDSSGQAEDLPPARTKGMICRAGKGLMSQRQRYIAKPPGAGDCFARANTAPFPHKGRGQISGRIMAAWLSSFPQPTPTPLRSVRARHPTTRSGTGHDLAQPGEEY